MKWSVQEFKRMFNAFRSRYTSCVGTRPAIKIGQLTEWPLKRLYRGQAVQCSISSKVQFVQRNQVLIS